MNLHTNLTFETRTSALHFGANSTDFAYAVS